MEPPLYLYFFSPFTRVLPKSTRPQSPQPAAGPHLSMNIKIILTSAPVLYCFNNTQGTDRDHNKHSCRTCRKKKKKYCYREPGNTLVTVLSLLTSIFVSLDHSNLVPTGHIFKFLRHAVNYSPGIASRWSGTSWRCAGRFPIQSAKSSLCVLLNKTLGLASWSCESPSQHLSSAPIAAIFVVQTKRFWSLVFRTVMPVLPKYVLSFASYH